MSSLAGQGRGAVSSLRLPVHFLSKAVNDACMN